MNILVILESNNGALHRLSREALVGAQELGGSIFALIIGNENEEILSELAGYELEKVINVKHHLLSSYSADGYSEVVRQVFISFSPDLIVIGHTYQTRDFIPRVSAKLDIPFIPDVISISDKGFIKQVLNAKLNATISNLDNAAIISFQSAAFNEEQLKLGSCSNESFDVTLVDSDIKSISEEPFQEEEGDVDLESAEVLVSVGRGIEKEENVTLAFELAKVINAEVSASRPVVDSGWVDSFRQVGSSGSNVAPKLYFSLGISGAIQHVVGMKGAKNIMAINKDADAPIFEISDYAVIGDILEIVPKLIESLGQSK